MAFPAFHVGRGGKVNENFYGGQKIYFGWTNYKKYKFEEQF